MYNLCLSTSLSLFVVTHIHTSPRYCLETVIPTHTHPRTATALPLPLCQAVSVSQQKGCGDEGPHTPLSAQSEKNKRRLWSIKCILGKLLLLPSAVTVQTLRAS